MIDMSMPFAGFSSFLFAAAYNLTNILSSPYTFWFPIVVAAAIAVIMIAILIGMLAPLLGRNNLVAWARLKAYEALATIILALIFLGFSFLLYSVNPVSALGTAGLVPPTCSASSPVNNLWGLGICDMYTFNQHVSDVMTAAYWLSFITGVSPTLSAEANFGGIGLGINGADFATGPNNLYLVPLFGLVYAEIMLSLLQVILLSSSAVLFSFLIGIGLIARAFGITRTFGNAMIALGIGIGFIYPLLVSVTYGFINTTFSNVISASGSSVLYLVQDLSFSSMLAFIPGLFSSSVGAGLLTGVAAQAWNFVALLVLSASIVGIGLVFIPILNFLILDAFVVDFSRSMGQTVSFMSMIENVL